MGKCDSKFSDRIVHLAYDFLEEAPTRDHYEAIISLTCLAWNLVVGFSPSARQLEMNHFLKEITPKAARHAIDDLLKTLMTRKASYYPKISQVIDDYFVVGEWPTVELQITSVVPDDELLTYND